MCAYALSLIPQVGEPLLITTFHFSQTAHILDVLYFLLFLGLHFWWVLLLLVAGVRNCFKSLCLNRVSDILQELWSGGLQRPRAKFFVNRAFPYNPKDF